MIPPDHPRYRSLVARERISRYAGEGVVTLEGLAAHGRGEAFDYLLGEKTTESALLAEKTAAALLLCAQRPVISVNGNTAALAADEVARLQERARARVEVNLFHRSEERIRRITRLLEEAGVAVEKGRPNASSPSRTTVHSACGRAYTLQTRSSSRSRTATGAARCATWERPSSRSTSTRSPGQHGRQASRSWTN